MNRCGLLLTCPCHLFPDPQCPFPFWKGFPLKSIKPKAPSSLPGLLRLDTGPQMGVHVLTCDSRAASHFKLNRLLVSWSQISPTPDDLGFLEGTLSFCQFRLVMAFITQGVNFRSPITQVGPSRFTRHGKKQALKGKTRWILFGQRGTRAEYSLAPWNHGCVSFFK